MSRSLYKPLHYNKYFFRKFVMSEQLNNLKRYNKYTYSRNLTIFKYEKFEYIYIYNGRHWFKKTLNPWIVGFKLGEFTWNKKPALYKATRLKKKIKK